MAMPKAALMRAVNDEIPLALLESIGSTYIPTSEIEALARSAITDDDGESTSFAGINRYVFVGSGNGAFIDPGGTLVQGAREEIKGMRRARGADPIGLKVRTRTMAQKQAPAKPAGIS